MEDNVVAMALNKEVSVDNIRNRIKNKQKERNKTEQLYNTEPDPTVKKIRWESLQKIDEEIVELTAELNAALEASKKKAKKTLQQVIKDNLIAYIASDDRYTMIRNYSNTESKVNLDVRHLTKIEIQPVLNILSGTPGAFDDLTAIDIRQCFEGCKRSFLIRTSSFDREKWNPTEVYNIIMEQKNFWAPIFKDAKYERMEYVYENLIDDEYDPAFDDLMYSLAGGKTENIEYLEKWVAFKRLYPEKCKITPGINITGVPGGNGKGMFTQMLASIFTDKGVSLVKAKNFTGGFNAIMEGKVVAVLDDEDKSKFPHSELKQTAGNQSWIIEPKGVDAYSVDATANVIVLDNTGLVKLVGGGKSGEDRRWGVIITNLTLLEVLQQKYDITEDQARQLANQYANQIFNDRIECGKWIAHIIRKHKVMDIDVLAPLHGADYATRLAEQKDAWTEIFERLLPIIVNQGFIPFKFIKEIVEAETGEKIKKATSLSQKFDEFMARKGHKNVEKTDINYKISWGSGTMSPLQKDKGSVRRIDPTAQVFDYKMISNAMWAKNSPINKDTLQIRDLGATIAEDDDEKLLFSNESTIQPRYPATPLDDDYDD